MLHYTPRPGYIEHINIANNQVSHNTKVKSEKKYQAIKSTKYHTKNTVAQHQVEQLEEKEMKTTLLKKLIQYRIQWEKKKIDTQSLTSTKQ
jgi:hypothetical protein